MIRRTIVFIKEVQSELSQVSWPTRRELWDSTKVVLVAMILLSGIIGIFDFLCSLAVEWIVRS